MIHKLKILINPNRVYSLLAVLFVSLSMNATAVVGSSGLTLEERRKYDYFFLEAIRMKEKQAYDAAFELFSHCLEIDPNAASSLYEIAQFYLYMKQDAKALETIQCAVDMDPDNYWYKQSLALYYLNKNEYANAIQVYEDINRRFPARTEALAALVDLYKRAENYEMVIDALNRFEEKEGKSEMISMEKFRIYLTAGNEKKAFEEIENLAKEYPYDMRYLSILGDVYMNYNRYDEAYKAYLKVLDNEPNNAMALVSIANYYDRTGQKEKYKQQLDKILLDNQVDSSLKLSIMRQLIVENEHSKEGPQHIITLFDSILKQDKEDTQIRMLYAQYLISKGKLDESKPVLWSIVELDPENNPARLQLLGYAINDNDYKQVIQITEPALKYSPETLEYYYFLALAYWQDEQERGKAYEVLTAAVKQITAESDKKLAAAIYAMLGEAYHNRKMKKEAFAAYDSALALNPDDVGTMNNYAYYLSVERVQLDKAEEMSYKTIKAEPKNETFLDTYAWILFEKGRYAEARLYIDEALKNGGQESEVIMEHAGDIYFMIGEKEHALDFWQKALEMGGESVTLKKKVEQQRYIP